MKKLLYLPLIGLGCLASAGLIIQQKNSSVSSHLAKLQTQIEHLQKSVNKPMPELNLKELTQKLTHLSSEVAGLRQDKSTSQLSRQLQDIQISMAHMESKRHPIRYLNSKELPFKVMSLDSIQQVPVASIAYDFKVVPLEKNESLAGWKIISLDYGKQHIEFENAKKERIALTQAEIGP